jgi:hypothetical protein
MTLKFQQGTFNWRFRQQKAMTKHALTSPKYFLTIHPFIFETSKHLSVYLFVSFFLSYTLRNVAFVRSTINDQLLLLLLLLLQGLG